MNDNAATPAPTPRRRLTAAERIQRQVSAISETGRALQIPRTPAALIGAATGYREAADRCAQQAMRENDQGVRMVWLEMAGINAVKAQVFDARALELSAG